MIRQIKYFQAVVRCQSFTKAAEECFISQSAISQQIQALEKELGVQLLKREGRKFSLTPVGEYFYKKSLVLVNDFERLCSETTRIAKGVEYELTIGYLKHFPGFFLQETIQEFNSKYPEVSINLLSGTHEELYEFLRKGKADIVINDLRRKPSAQYVNYFLAEAKFYAELPLNNPLAQLEFLTAEDLKNTPIIIISSAGQKYNEELFFREYFGVKSEFIFAENLQEAHLLASSNNGYFPVEFNHAPPASKIFKYVPIFYNGAQFFRKYYAFWRVESQKKYLEEFASILKIYLQK